MLLEPFGYEFFRHGLIAATLTGALCGLMGVYIVLRRMSYIGHGLSHAVFGGAVVSALVGWNFFIGAGAWGFLSALLIQGTARRRNIGADAAIGIVTTASFALGVALISRTRSFEQNFESALFGNILGVTPEDLLAIGVVAAVIAVAVFFGYKQLLVHDVRPGDRADLRRSHALGRCRVRPGAGGDDRRLHERGRRDADRGGDRHPAGGGAAADRFLRPSDHHLHRVRRGLRFRRDVRFVLLGHRLGPGHHPPRRGRLWRHLRPDRGAWPSRTWRGACLVDSDTKAHGRSRLIFHSVDTPFVIRPL